MSDHSDIELEHVLPKNEVETPVAVEYSQLSSETKVIVAIPEESHGLGLVFHPDIFGLTPKVDDAIFQIAARGVPTIAVEPFTRLEKNGFDGERDEDGQIPREVKMRRVKELDDVEQCADLLAAAQILRSQHACEKVALIGFCIGGMYSFKAAGVGLFDAVVSCYGMITLPEHWEGKGQRQPLDYLMMESVSPLLAIIGGKDTYAGDEDLQKFQDVLTSPLHKEIGSHIEIFENAEHAFMHDPKRESFRFQDSKDAWALAFEFISEKTGLQI